MLCDNDPNGSPGTGGSTTANSLQPTTTIDRSLQTNLARYSGPIDLIYGDDNIYDAQTIAALHAKLKGSHLEFVESAGHFPWVEQPKAFYAKLAAVIQARK